jgi:hypothetical protein
MQSLVALAILREFLGRETQVGRSEDEHSKGS